MQQKMPKRMNRCFRRSILMLTAIAVVAWWQLIGFMTIAKTRKNHALASNDRETAYEVENYEPFNNRYAQYFYELQMMQREIMTPSAIDVEDEVKNSNSYDVKLKRIVERINSEQKIRNLDRYGHLTNNSLVIVVQVHNRIGYLRETIGSLSRARGIEDALLVFSHDYFDDGINDLVRGIDFCKTTQIFFPYSLQIYTDAFPGQSPNDCPRNITRQDAIRINCANAMFSDKDGKYRDPSVTQSKHHWWWKANTVFDRLEAVKYFTGPVLFIEEDHYVVEDFMHVMKLMRRACPRSKIFSLGSGDHTHTLNDINLSFLEIKVSRWISNLGVSFNRSVWEELVQCADVFCNYDDYNWDWSLQKTAKTCPGRSFFTATVLRSSRIHHIGNCGMHHKNDSCTDVSHVENLKRRLNGLTLYPKLAAVTTGKLDANRILGPSNGGWGDVRDRRLCMRMVVRRRE